MGRKVLFVGFFLVATLVIAIVADINGYKDGYQAGLTRARVDSWDRELLWRKALAEIGRDTSGLPVHISVVFLDPQTTFSDAPGNVAIGLFSERGESLFTRYTIQRATIKKERYADEWGKRLIGLPVTSY